MVAVQVSLVGVEVGNRVQVIEVVVLVLTVTGWVVAKAGNHSQTVPVSVGWNLHIGSEARRLPTVSIRIEAVNVRPVNQLGLGPTNFPAIIQHNDVWVLVVHTS